jgi:single-strand DNA-binding protein
MPRSKRVMKRSSPGSIPYLSGPTLRAISGARRHVAALLSGLLSQSKSGPLLQNARLGTWEPGSSLRLRQWVTRSIREFKQRRLTMYQNRVTLIGFLGQDAVTRTANNASFTALSLATKSSYKDKKTGKYIDHTEWHHCIVWGRLAEYAKTLTKGAHLSVEGELRSRERVDKKTSQKQRVWEVRVASILKLDRAEKASPEEQSDDDLNPEEEAA